MTSAIRVEGDRLKWCNATVTTFLFDMILKKANFIASDSIAQRVIPVVAHYLIQP